MNVRIKLLHSRAVVPSDGDENWMPVQFFEHYEVSDKGRVRSSSRAGEPRLLRQKTDKQMGRKRVTLCIDGYATTRLVHHLVLEAFIGHRPDGHECRHLDGNAGNNELSNLTWGTHRENMWDKERHGTLGRGDDHWMKRKPERVARGERSGGAKLTDNHVREMRADRASTSKDLAKKYGVSQMVISRARRGLRWAHVDGAEVTGVPVCKWTRRLTSEARQQILSMWSDGTRIAAIARATSFGWTTVKRVISSVEP